MSALLLLFSLYLPWIFILGVIAQAATPAGSQIVSKPLAWFRVKSNSRKHFDEAGLRELGRDLRIRQIQPLVCLPDGTIICGERRYRAAVMEGLIELAVSIITDPIAEGEFDRLQLSENLHRKDLNNSEKCEGCVKFARLNPGMTNKQIAEVLNVDPSLVTRWMAWEKVIEPVREALAAGKISLTGLYAISLVPPEQQAELLATALAAPNAAAVTSASRRQRNGNGKGDTVRIDRCPLPLPSGIQVTVTGKNLSLADLITALGEAMKEAKSAADQMLDIRTLAVVAKDKAAKKAAVPSVEAAKDKAKKGA